MQTRNEEGKMTNEERRLIVETLGEMRELKGEMQEFKKHVIERVQHLEKKEGERNRQRLSITGILISSAALAVSIIVNFFRRGGK
jgi:L-lactate utilization protein LutB